MGESLDKASSNQGRDNPEPQQQNVKQEEFRQSMRLQAMLALVEYVDWHKVAIDPPSFLKREDDIAHQIRHNAGIEWSGSSNREPSLAQVFERYWKGHAEQLMKIKTDDSVACKELLEELHKFRRQLMEGGQ